jgi:hypothetical protein
MRLLLFAAALSLAPLLDAQTAAEPHLSIDTVGPDGWRSRLGPTNLGSLLESEQGRALWRPQVDPLLAIWRELAGDEAVYAASNERLLGYAGRIRAAFWFDLEGRAGDPPQCIAVALEGDGKSDLAAIAADLRRFLYEALPGEWRDVELAGRSRAVRVGADVAVTAPFDHEGALLAAAAPIDGLEQAVQRALALAADRTPLRPDSPALRLRVAFGTMVRHALAADDEDNDWQRAIGLDSIGDGTITIGGAGPRVLVEYAQEFTSDERRLFAALMPATPEVPTLLAAVPPTGTWTVGHFDLGLLYESVLAAIDASEGGDARAEVKKSVGIDLGPDLLAHATDEVMLALYDSEDFFDHPERLPWTLAWRLRDAAAFEQGLLALLPHFKPYFSREASEEHAGIALFRYGNMLSYDVWLAVGNGVFAASGGHEAKEHLTALLDRCAALPAERPAAAELPAGFTSLRRYLPPATHGFAQGSAANLVRIPSGLWFGLLGELSPFPDLGREVLDPEAEAERGEQLAALLAQHDLGVARAATSYTGRTWRWRLYW